MDGVGYIYILTNPSIPQYVKIGYADDVESRLRALNRSECLPFAFRVYATYEVDSRLSDKKLHSIIDKLNPDLRSIEQLDGKKRVREFYAMDAEDAYSILEAVAEMHGFGHRLRLAEVSIEDQEATKVAQEVDSEYKKHRSPFRFSMCNIGIGETVCSLEFPEIECVVVDDNHISYNGEIYSMSTLGSSLLGWKHRCSGPLHFTYKGEILDTLRRRLEDNY